METQDFEIVQHQIAQLQVQCENLTHIIMGIKAFLGVEDDA